MALGADNITQVNGHYESRSVIDENIVNKIKQNTIDIENYKKLLTDMEPLKTSIDECKSNLDCCYNDASLGLVVDGISYESMVGYSESMTSSSAEIDAQIGEINKQIIILEATNGDLEKEKYKTISVWVND